MLLLVEYSWNVMAHGDEREGKWRGNWRMDWVASTLHTTSKHGVSNITTITTADAHTSAASSRLNWRPRWFKWTRPFRRKMKSGFCACAVTFQTQSTKILQLFSTHAEKTPSTMSTAGLKISADKPSFIQSVFNDQVQNVFKTTKSLCINIMFTYRYYCHYHKFDKCWPCQRALIYFVATLEV